MFLIILYLITAICYYLVFFKVREEHYEYKTDNSYNGEWVDKGKAKYPIWMWILTGAIALIPILGILVMAFCVISFIIGFGDTYDRERYKLNISCLEKKY